MRFKKFLALLMTIVSVSTLYLSPALAANSPTASSISTKNVIVLEDGSYIIEEIVETASIQSARTTSTKSGYKNATYYTRSNVAIFTVRVTGSFEYTGTSSKATSSSATVYLNHASATFVSKSAFCSGISAYATGSVSYIGETLTHSVALSCSATGVLS